MAEPAPSELALILAPLSSLKATAVKVALNMPPLKLTAVAPAAKALKVMLAMDRPRKVPPLNSALRGDAQAYRALVMTSDESVMAPVLRASR